MSYFVINPNTNPFYFAIRGEEIKDAINIYYDYVIIGKGVRLDINSKKCVLYDYDPNRAILTFPLIARVDMTDFVDKSSWISSFEYLGIELLEGEEQLVPSDSVPRSDPTMSVSDYLGISYDEDIEMQDLTMRRSANIRDLSMVKVNNSKVLKNLFDIWKEYGTNDLGESMNRLELGSYLMRRSEEEYLNIKMYNIESVALDLNYFRRIDQSCENIITEIIYQSVVDTIVFCDKEWWFFEEGKWKKDDGKYVWDIVSKSAIESITSISIVDDSINTSLRLFMGSTATRLRLCKDLSMKLSDFKFKDKMDSNTRLLGVQNGTFVLNEGVLRKSLPGDYISLSCDIRYMENTNVEEEINLMVILQQIFPEEDVLRFFIRSCASMLEGYNKYKVFYVWWGTGNNAKTLLQRFVSSTLGEYSISLSTSLITGKRSRSSEATPDMYYSKNKLAVFLQEPNPDEKIQVGRIKELTGNDKMYVRELFKSGTVMEFKAKIVIVTNNPIDAPGMDVAFRRRILVIPFETTFDDKKKDNDKSKYRLPMEPDMEKKMFKYREAFLRILVNEYQKFMEDGLEVPSYIKRTTLNYLTLNNRPLKFIQQYLYKEPDSTLALMDIYEKFKEWFWSSYPHRMVPALEALSSELSNEDYEEVDGLVKNIGFV